MPALECSLGADCTKGPDGGVWKTQDLPFDQARELVADHVKFAHNPDGASGAPAQQRSVMISSGDHVNVNDGVMGGNFDNCDLHHPIFYVQSPSGTFRQQSAYPPFILISSSGSAADYHASMLGLYSKTEEMFGNCSVYTQEHDNTKYGGLPCKLFRDRGIWNIIEDGVPDACLMAAEPSESPTSSVMWQYLTEAGICLDDPALRVTGLSEKPRSCEITISLREDIAKNIMEPGADGVYREDGSGSYCWGRPVLQHSGGHFKLIVGGEYWRVYSRAGGVEHLLSRSAPSMCPADPRAARNERHRKTLWEYTSKKTGWTESSGISHKCKTKTHMY